ncbi:MAG: hypothetical protein ACK58L_15705 [Planctomycetota bacterium]
MKLLTRQLWMDEVHSWLLLTDPDPSHALTALADGVDFNPPAWFVVTRTLLVDPEFANEFQIRLLSLFWTITSIAGLCLLLLQRFDLSVSCIAILLTMSQPLLIHHATEIRFYGFWCACCIWVCVLLSWCPATSGKLVFQKACLAILGFAICSTHYFGILSIGLMLLPVVWKRWSGWKSDLISMSLGAGLSLICLVKYLPGQRAVLSRPTWISPTTVSDTFGFLNSLLPAWQLAVCLAALLVSMRQFQSIGQAVIPRNVSERERFLPLLALCGMPLLIILVAWCLQPSLVTRYAMICLPALAVVSAWALQSCGKNVRIIAAFIASIGLFLAVSNRVRDWALEEEPRFRLVEQLRSLPPDATVIFEDRIEWMPILHHFPDLRERCCLADFQDGQLSKDSSLRIVQRDVGRSVQVWYPMYRMIPIDQLAKVSSYYVVPYYGRGLNDLKYPSCGQIERCSDLLFRRVATVNEAFGTGEITKMKKNFLTRKIPDLLFWKLVLKKTIAIESVFDCSDLSRLKCSLCNRRDFQVDDTPP